MHVLITGAAGMIGRKLTERLVKDGSLNGQVVDRLTLTDVVAPTAPPGFSGKIDARVDDLPAPGAAPGWRATKGAARGPRSRRARTRP